MLRSYYNLPLYRVYNHFSTLSDRELRKLKEHKYSSSCSSILDPTMQK